MSEIGVLRCPACGAPSEPKATACSYCRIALHPVRCPWCFAWTYAESRDCPACGAKSEPAAEGATPLSCPACKEPLSARRSGRALLCGCMRCAGVWADAASFQTICDDRSTQAAYLGEGSVLPRPEISDPTASPVMYRPCPKCGELMNRFNFANCSGVILDACKPHGVWFDSDELKSIVQFIRGGGLDMARSKERQQLELERRRVERAAQEQGQERRVSQIVFGTPETIASARGLLDIFFG